MKSSLKAELILLAIATVWAATFVLIKVTLLFLSPFYFLGIRFTIASALFYIIFFKRIRFTNKAELRAGIFLGLLLFAGFASQTAGLQYTSASNSALITGVNILIIPFVQYFITGKKVLTENWIGVILVFIGLYFLTQPFQTGINKGDLITLICALAWAFYILYLDPLTKKYNLYFLVLTQFIVVGFLSVLIALFTENVSQLIFNKISLLGLAYTAVPATLGATYFANKYQKETTPIRAGLIITWEQPAAVIFAIIFLKDKLEMLQLFGGFLMVAGIVYSETYGYFIMRKAEVS